MIAGAVVAFFLLLLITVPFLFKDRIALEIKKLANQSLTTELNYRDISVSFFDHFPNLTMSITDFSVMGSGPFRQDTLISAREVGFGINLKSLFSDRITINKLFLTNAGINIRYDKQGISNFDIYKSGDSLPATADTSAGASLSIEDIALSNSRLTYSDASIPFEVIASGLNYSGKSIYSANIFNVDSKVRIDSLDVTYDNNALLSRKPVTARMNTKVNTNDLTIFFEKNDLKIKDIPLQFNGRFNFEKDGYALSLTFLSVMEKEFLSARFKLSQGKKMYIAVRATASVDLERWTKAVDFQTAELKGFYDLSLTADGYYETGPVTQGPRGETDTAILSIPKFELMTRLSNGYFKYKSLPQSVTNMGFSFNATCRDEDYHHIRVTLDSLKAVLLGNTLNGRFVLGNLSEMPVEARFSSRLDLARLREVVPLDSLELAGLLDVNLDVKGNYNPDKGQFPVTTAQISLADGKIQTSYYPHPLKKIEMKTVVVSRKGSMEDLTVTIDPISFNFEDKPFYIKALITNLNDVSYDIRSKGEIDLGKVYKVFSMKGLDLEGFIATDLSLKGRQSDAMSQRFDRLQNKGTLILRDIALRSDDYPKPFIIRSGNFRFDQDKIWFDQFRAIYGNSDFEMKGFLKNTIAYMLSQGKTLRGDFTLHSALINVDEFTYFAPSGKQPATPAASTGVVIIPRDLDIDFNMAAERVTFSGLDIRNIKGELDLKEGILVLSKAGFELIGCKVALDATYGSITPRKAHFDFKIKADDFDVKRAYNEIAMVRDMASSAAYTEGLVSLDYQLNGILNDAMYPILPSVEGSGILTVKKVKVKGFKLFGDISKSTQKEGLANPDISKVEIRSSIKNSTVTFEQFKFKVSGIRFRISGSSTFDNVLNMRIRLGLPPLGIFGIPLKVTGPLDNLKIRYGRGKDTEEIQDSDYSDELPAEMLERIRKAKDDGDEEEK
jgi:AsmA protein